jgi:RNA polymerase sigma-70 factor (ECF subfamily)
MNHPKPDFETVYAQYAPKVYRVCFGYLNDATQAQDLVQETFIKVWQHLGDFRGESAIGTWIFRIATNICLRTIERSKRMPVAPIPPQLEAEDESFDESRIALMHRAIATLDSADRIIISLVLEGLPHNEIAEIIGITSVNVRVKAHRIKEKLAKYINDHE